MRRHFSALFALLVIAGCAAGSGAVVQGAGSDLLKLRKGPGLDHEIIIGLPDGTRVTRQSCQVTSGRTWCKVILTDRPAISGYVSAEYLGHR